MRRTPYLNVVLTVNAALLTGLLWTQVAERPLVANTAQAQNRSNPNRVFVPPNSAKLLKSTMEEIASLKVEMTEIQKTLKSGKVRVEVTNLKDLQLPSNED